MVVKTKLILFTFISLVILMGLAIAVKPNNPGNSGGNTGPASECNDHIDNDGDGFCDFSWKKVRCDDGSIPGDLDCLSKSDNTEASSCSINCTLNSECGIDGNIGGLYCGGDGNVYQDFQNFICLDPGECIASCSNQINTQLIENCLNNGCTNGQCNTLPISEELVKVAFIGDQAINSNAVSVLQLIQNEGAEIVLHQGDFGYGNENDIQTAIDWDNQINSVLGINFPYFGAVGNHDLGIWNDLGGYQDLLEARLDRVPEANCTGEYGVNSACTYKGIFFILSGVGTLGSSHTNFIETELINDNSKWSICSWHKNQNAMQIGGKLDDVGWPAYEACLRGGAIIATGHEHTYERTKTLISTEFQIIDQDWPDPNNLRVANGSTFVFVSGIAGRAINSQQRCFPTTYPYGCNGEWASIYASNQGANFGALFCTFNTSIQNNQAECYFKDINNNVPDIFTITSEM